MQVISVPESVLSPLEGPLNALAEALIDYDWPELPAIPEDFDSADSVSIDALEEAKSRDVLASLLPRGNRAIGLNPPKRTAEDGSLGSMTPAELLGDKMLDFLYAFQVSNPVLLGVTHGVCHHLPGTEEQHAWLGWHSFATNPGYTLQMSYAHEPDLSLLRWEQEGQLRTIYLPEGWDFRLLKLGDTNRPSWICNHSQTQQTILRINLGEISPQFVKSFLAVR